MYDINKLINSENEHLRKIGWLLYDREDQDGGLNNDELDNLIHILNDFNEDDFDSILAEEYEKGYQEGYNDGAND